MGSIFGKGKRPSIHQIKEYVAETGCLVLDSDYTNQDTHMTFRCSCGNTFKATLRVFRSGTRCKACNSKKIADKRRYTQKEVETYLKEHACKLLSKYTGINDPITYICTCGNEHTSTFACFKKGARCNTCKHKNLMNNRPNRFNYTYVKQYFEDHGCKLLSTHYQNGRQKLDYICTCGRLAKIAFREFKQGSRCFQCMVDNLSGENSKWYDPTLTEEQREAYRKRKRKIVGYRPWKRLVHARDNYTCQKCGSTEHLEAHHIENFAHNENIRFDANNGITLCKDCHVLFHTRYTTRNNNREQLEEFLWPDY